MSKEEEIKLTEQQKEKLLSELIFEVACLGCGKVKFNLPYKKNSYHTLTCQQCGEVTIAHVCDNGNIITATAEQRDKALESTMDELVEYIKGFKKYDNKYDYRNFKWVRNGQSIRAMNKEDFQLDINLSCKGLYVEIIKIYKPRYKTTKIPEMNFSHLSGPLKIGKKTNQPGKKTNQSGKK